MPAGLDPVGRRQRTGTGMWIPGVANVAMRDVPPGLSGTASGVFNASRQVGTSIGLAILGAIGADAATSAWTSQAAHLPGAARRAAIARRQACTIRPPR
jgi:DHA2 family methylenomycin A resistance protein-like MFS transporter